MFPHQDFVISDVTYSTPDIIIYIMAIELLNLNGQISKYTCSLNFYELFFYQKTCIYKDLEKTSNFAERTGSKRPDKYLVVRNNTCNLSQCFFNKYTYTMALLT